MRYGGGVIKIAGPAPRLASGALANEGGHARDDAALGVLACRGDGERHELHWWRDRRKRQASRSAPTGQIVGTESKQRGDIRCDHTIGVPGYGRDTPVPTARPALATVEAAQEV